LKSDELLLFYRVWQATMISSPCKTCHKSTQPKEDCYKDCALLQAIQEIQLSAKADLMAPGIDPSEENRFTVIHSAAKHLRPYG